MSDTDTNDPNLPGSLVKQWSTYGARGPRV
jgi:hypothetical protein